MIKNIYIGNDHGGYEAKRMIVDYLKTRNVAVSDVGSNTYDVVRYPYYAARVANAVASGKVDAGILICSTGIGMSIIANKFKGVRASVCTSHYMAMMTRRHNNSNILCLGGKITGSFEMMDIVEAWIDNEYEGGRHDISLAMIQQGEDAMITGNAWMPPQDLEL